MINRHLFYSDLLDLTELIEKVDAMGMAAEEREEIIYLIEEIIHHRIMDTVFDILPSHHHNEFISKLAREPHAKELLIFIREKTDETADEKIVSVFMTVKEELISEIIPLSKNRKGKKAKIKRG